MLNHRKSMCLVVATLAAVWALPAPAASPPEQLGVSSRQLGYVDPLLEQAYNDGQFCGCVLLAGRRDGVFLERVVGDRQVEPVRKPMEIDSVFDLASLTKPVATATSVMLLVERGQVRLSDPVSQYLVELDRDATRDVTIDQLLTHAAGFVPDNSIRDYQDGPAEAWRRLLALDPQKPPGHVFQYSDVNFELLGKLVERVDGRPLERFVADELFEPLGMNDTMFLPTEPLQRRAVATEQRDGEWLVGEVHDPRAALLGGVAGHAGLFSTAADLARYAQMMLGEGSVENVRVLSPLTVREMIRPRVVAEARRGAGWDVRSPYSKNRGDLLSDAAFGHGGFTGTVLWIDPQLDLFVVFLSSRLHPDGDGVVNDLAGRLGTVVAAAIVEPAGE
ncbi:Esterase EstB [Pirellulimonas nuda]|uniref:Esterase EstB n=1 Tax=Pirellulimonas nuda TaxID=2528009 RepID=A0A518DAN8_9BACT|nr:serine hydrolase domain-containing protein [Pirellulimonas nuda]QDU88513.1 Esterase EstB [Pirellulimonas nuda]